jgi:Mrp family chromosome partitioning ATPase
VSDDRRRRRDEPRGPRGAAPDVEVFSLPDLDQQPAEEQSRLEADEGPPPGRWLDEVRTAIWEDSRQVEPPSGSEAEEPIKRRQTKRLPPGLAATPSPAPSATPGPATVRPSPHLTPSPSRGSPGPIRRGSSASRSQRAVHEDVPAERALVPTGSSPIDVDEEPVEREVQLLEAPLRIVFNSVAQISPDPRLWVMTEPGSAGAEQYRVLALKLREGRGVRAVAFVAPTSDAEGCLAAGNVALALAEGHRGKVLLLDTNLRRPEVASLFGLQEGVGLGEQLRHHRRAAQDPWEVCSVSRSLHLLPAGPPEKNPSALLSSDALADLMAEARRAFDHIVVAAPPAIESADINILQDSLDGVVLVARAGVTRRDSVAASVTRLGAARLLGTVLVGT